jgi:hypothetical protein
MVAVQGPDCGPPLIHSFIHSLIHSTRHVLTGVAKCIDVDGGIFENVLC